MFSLRRRRGVLGARGPAESDSRFPRRCSEYRHVGRWAMPFARRPGIAGEELEYLAPMETAVRPYPEPAGGG
jgi:hypothetical protein